MSIREEAIDLGVVLLQVPVFTGDDLLDESLVLIRFDLLDLVVNAHPLDEGVPLEIVEGLDFLGSWKSVLICKEV